MPAGNANPTMVPQRITDAFFRHIVDGVLAELRHWGMKAVV